MNIEIFDSRDIPAPQDRVVAQALASRSLKPFREHLDEMSEQKTTAFYEKNVIGFGHDNINAAGDSIIVSLPGVSILAAKYIEDSPLFNGQESSTRYIDFSKQPLLAKTEKGEKVAQKLLDLFNRRFDSEVLYNFENFNPADEVAKKAVKAYTLDVMRSILPAGLTTNVNWVTNLRQVQDHCHYLIGCDIPEVSKIGTMVFLTLQDKYPGIIIPINSDSTTHMYNFANEYHYYNEDPSYEGLDSTFSGYDPLKQKLSIFYNEEDLENIHELKSLELRPRGCPVPRIYGTNFAIIGLLDFGSFRDLQRHRNGMCKIPPLNTYNGFEDWYLDKMSDELKQEVLELLDYVETEFRELQDPYIVPLGYRVPFLYQCDFAQLVYIAELRSSKYVHPTCRSIALHISAFIKTNFPDIKLYTDHSPLDHFHAGRGRHDIESK